MNLRIAGRKQPWKSRHFDQTRFDFLIVALAGVFIAGKVMQTKGLTEKKAARKLRLGAGTEAEEKPARLLSVMAGGWFCPSHQPRFVSAARSLHSFAKT